MCVFGLVRMPAPLVHAQSTDPFNRDDPPRHTTPHQEGAAPLPAALFLSTPWSDLSDAGDSYATLAFVDSRIVTYHGALGGARPPWSCVVWPVSLHSLHR